MSVWKLPTTAALWTALARQLAGYRQAANYLTVAQIYLQDNVLLDQPSRPSHIKERLRGHWGTCPGINLIYAHLNCLVLERGANVLLITGPGHGAAAYLANLHMAGTLATFYPELTLVRMTHHVEAAQQSKASHVAPG